MPDRALSSSLAAVAAIMAEATAPWWVIGSAAVVLHGGDTEAADVDVLLDVMDADRIDARLGLDLRDGTGTLFRSERYGRWGGTAMPVEFMASLRIRGGSILSPATRVAVPVGSAVVYVPDCEELIAILTLFGRPKDLARATLLRARPS